MNCDSRVNGMSCHPVPDPSGAEGIVLDRVLVAYPSTAAATLRLDNVIQMPLIWLQSTDRDVHFVRQDSLT